MSSTARRYRRQIQRRMVDTAVRARGCSCAYDLVHTGTGRVRVEHDDDCPMIGRRQILVMRLPKRCER